MEKLIKSIEGVHPGKYDLRRNELDELYDAYAQLAAYTHNQLRNEVLKNGE